MATKLHIYAIYEPHTNLLVSTVWLGMLYTDDDGNTTNDATNINDTIQLHSLHLPNWPDQPITLQPAQMEE